MFGYTPLSFACMQNQGHNSKEFRFRCIKALVKYKASPNSFNNRTLWSPIHWLAYYGDLKSLKFLIENGAVTVIPDFEGNLPMDLAAKFNYVEVVKELI